MIRLEDGAFVLCSSKVCIFGLSCLVLGQGSRDALLPAACAIWANTFLFSSGVCAVALGQPLGWFALGPVLAMLVTVVFGGACLVAGEFARTAGDDRNLVDECLSAGLPDGEYKAISSHVTEVASKLFLELPGRELDTTFASSWTQGLGPPHRVAAVTLSRGTATARFWQDHRNYQGGVINNGRMTLKRTVRITRLKPGLSVHARA